MDIMLNRIKLMLNIQDDSKTELIMLYISKITDEVLDYCNIEVLTPKLKSFVENKICKILNPNSQIKSISRGDTSISYVTENEFSTGLSDADRSYLNSSVRCSVW